MSKSHIFTVESQIRLYYVLYGNHNEQGLIKCVVKRTPTFTVTEKRLCTVR